MSLSNGSLAVGTVIDDKFRIEKVLGEGAVGVVVRALHLKLGTPVALKFLLPRMLGDKIVVERFAREARASARMTSEHVARVLDVGNVEQGAPYMVMEYLSGETLGDAMKRRRTIPVSEACSYMIQICDALTEAHALGIIHRDLKPANLFLSVRPNGKTVVKVLDFGISKIGDASGDELTMASSILGTPLYMAPEQIASSRTVDGRADIWSCGIVLHRMLCGVVPFDAGSLIELGAKLIKERPPRLDALRPDIPTELANTVLKCLEKDVTRRWQSAGDLANALSRWVVSTVSGASPAVPLEDDPVEPTIALRAVRGREPPRANERERDLAPPADQAETMTIVSGTSRTITASSSSTSSSSKGKQQKKQPSIVDVTLEAIPPEALPPPPAPAPILGVKRPKPVPQPPTPTAPAAVRYAPRDHGGEHDYDREHHHHGHSLEQDLDRDYDPGHDHDPTRLAAPMMTPMHPGSYPPLPPTQQGTRLLPSGSRTAPTVQTRMPTFADQIEKHPYFGVGLVFLLAIFIAAIALFARSVGCMGGPHTTLEQVETPSIDELDRITIPSWALREVTDDASYSAITIASLASRSENLPSKSS